MKWKLIAISTALVAALVPAGVVFAQSAEAAEGHHAFEASVLGGVQGLMKNDTSLPDDFVNVPVVASFGYRATSIFALEGEVAWLIPVKNTVDVGSGTSQDLKSPDVLTYQANVRASLPVGSNAWWPYVTAGAGAMTFLSTTDADRYPKLPESQTAFAINFGLGSSFPLTESIALRADFREFVAFPKDDAVGLSKGNTADPMWMPRGTFGLSYRF